MITLATACNLLLVVFTIFAGLVLCVLVLLSFAAAAYEREKEHGGLDD